ncbi:monocarboxylate transporter 9-like [Asterias rubens]|uniref:monocarboxylate transporter 9-like n=1 Tax=Asterias rubens TaxID=7604 RepID=UPI001455C4D5|nr:monocarboxylate transporter 9-like [Asterias rubens]
MVESVSRKWRWFRLMIPVACNIQLILIKGIVYNYSILFVNFRDEFGSSEALTGWPGSIANASAGLLSPVASLLLRVVSHRTLILIGHVVFLSGLMLTSLARNFWYVLLTFGILGGVANDFVLVATNGIVLKWFAAGTSFLRASAVMFLGTSLGILIFSPLLTACITQYGWRNALRIVSSGIFVMGVAIGLILRDPSTTVNDRQDVADIEDGSKEASPLNEEETNVYGCEDVQPSIDGNPEIQSLFEEPKMQDEDLTRLQEEKKCCFSSYHCEVLEMMTRFEPTAWGIGITLSQIGWTFFIINFASLMDRHGLNNQQISLALVFFAFGDLIGKLLIAIFGGSLPFQRVYYLSASMFLATAEFGVMSIANTIEHFLALSIVGGLIRSVLYGAAMGISADIFADTYSNNGVTILALFPIGIGILIGGPLAGGLYDVTGNYIVSLLVIAALFVCSALLVLSIPIRRRLQSGSLCCARTTATHVQV